MLTLTLDVFVDKTGTFIAVIRLPGSAVTMIPALKVPILLVPIPPKSSPSPR